MSLAFVFCIHIQIENQFLKFPRLVVLILGSGYFIHMILELVTMWMQNKQNVATSHWSLLFYVPWLVFTCSTVLSLFRNSFQFYFYFICLTTVKLKFQNRKENYRTNKTNSKKTRQKNSDCCEEIVFGLKEKYLWLWRDIIVGWNFIMNEQTRTTANYIIISWNKPF